MLVMSSRNVDDSLLDLRMKLLPYFSGEMAMSICHDFYIIFAL